MADGSFLLASDLGLLATPGALADAALFPLPHDEALTVRNRVDLLRAKLRKEDLK